jgi:exopolysaccharide/PEP-CTERM locus tyrosine autokinase
MSTIEKALQKKIEAQQEPNDQKKGTSIDRAMSASAAKSETNKQRELDQQSGEAEVEKVGNQSSQISLKDTRDGKPPTRFETEGQLKAKKVEIDIQRLENAGFVSVHSTRRVINEEYRAIKRKLLQNAFGAISSTLNNSNIIMVSSARPSEGKTFTAVNLALSIAAEKDKTVLLVDADVLRPKVSKTLAIEPKEGLMEYLLDEKSDISEVMYSTNIDKLRIIPAGRSHHLSTELLASQKMHNTIDEIASRYPDRVVIIDCPPLIGINETAILASFAGQAVVVTVEGKSKISDINAATSQLNPEMAVGFVVNQAIVSVDENQGYYGYYYAN